MTKQLPTDAELRVSYRAIIANENRTALERKLGVNKPSRLPSPQGWRGEPVRQLPSRSAGPVFFERVKRIDAKEFFQDLAALIATVFLILFIGIAAAVLA